MSPAASFLPRIAFALRASRVAALPPLAHAAAQAGWFERLSGQFIILERCDLHKVLDTIVGCGSCVFIHFSGSYVPGADSGNYIPGKHINNFIIGYG
jgi:hypothetical protein